MADQEKRCPNCGAVIPEGFSDCPACHVIRDEAPSRTSSFARGALLRRNILLATAGTIAILMVILLPRLGSSNASTTVAETMEQTVSETLEERETNEKEGRPAVSSTGKKEQAPAETADAQNAGATVDNVVTAPGQNGHTHVYVKTITTPATCTEEGEATYTCSGCGDSYTEEIPKTDHEWKEATCTEPATCVNCGETDGVPLGHQLVNGVCSRCGYSTAREEEIRKENDRYKTEKAQIESDYQAKIQPYKNEVAALQEKINSLLTRREELKDSIAMQTDQSEKDRLTEELKEVENSINEKQLSYSDCLNSIDKLTAEKEAALEQAESKHQANIQAINEKYS